MNATPVNKNIAKKYAQAFMSVYPKAFAFNDIKKIESARTFLQNHKRTLFFLQLPQFDTERKKSMIADLVDYFSLPHSFSAIILMLIQHNRTSYIPSVFYWIIQLYYTQINAVAFSITSAHELNSDQVDSMEKFLEQSLHKKIIGTPLVNKSLIAGVRLQSNDYLWEYSVRKQIRNLKTLQKI